MKEKYLKEKYILEKITIKSFEDGLLIRQTRESFSIGKTLVLV